MAYAPFLPGVKELSDSCTKTNVTLFPVVAEAELLASVYEQNFDVSHVACLVFYSGRQRTGICG